MVEIIGVRFQNGGKVYYFSPDSWKVKQGDLVITETSRGTECGEVAIANKQIPKEQVTVPLKPILRVATREDHRTLEQNRKKEERAFQVCQQKIAYRKLKMNLVDVECTFDNSKLLFYFTADNRVDFRELVKDLAAVFRTRIELRQIGVRDKAKILGGIGICGREFCCKGHLQDFQPVSIKMAKEQGLSLNPTKISGSCGRLMCCLKYEQDAYEYLNSLTPGVGATVKTPEGNAVVTDANLMTGYLTVRLTDSDSMPFKIHRDDVKRLSRFKKRPKRDSE